MKSNAYSAAGLKAEKEDGSVVVNEAGNFTANDKAATEFFDPSGYNYVFLISTSGNETWNWISTPVANGAKPSINTGYTIHIYQKMHCEGENAVADQSNRVVAYRYRLESSGYYCGDNV